MTQTRFECEPRMYSFVEFLLFSISFVLLPLPVFSLLNYWLLALTGSYKDIDFQKIIGLGLTDRENYIAAIRKITIHNVIVVLIGTLTVGSPNKWLNYFNLVYPIWLTTVMVSSTLVVFSRWIDMCRHRWRVYNPYEQGHKVALRAWLKMMVLSWAAVYVRTCQTDMTVIHMIATSIENIWE